MKTLVLLGLALVVGAPSRVDAGEGDGAQIAGQEDNRTVVKLDASAVPCQIVINGTAVPPLIFFFNTDVRNDKYLGPRPHLLSLVALLLVLLFDLTCSLGSTYPTVG